MKFVLALLFVSSFAFAIDNADKMFIAVSSGSIVLPTNLKDSDPMQTCVAGGVRGPRVRMSAAIKWYGQGQFLPLVIHTSFKNINFSSAYSNVISPGKGSFESLAFMFGLQTDYIPSGSAIHETKICFLDHGDLPKPLKELTESDKLEVPATVAIAGVIRQANGDEEPVVKELPITIIYTAGSVRTP